MSKIAVLVEYEIHDGQAEALTALMSEHARLTLAEEPGCLRFELVRPMERDGTEIPNRLILTELYATGAAFALHEKNPRMPDLGAASRPLLRSTRLTYGLVD